MRNAAATLFLTLALGATARAGSPVEAWQALAGYRPDQALPRFTQLAAGGSAADTRAARFGLAVSLLAQQNAQADRVEQARVLLTALSSDGVDDIALGARFFLSRLAEYQVEPADPARAATGFRRLIAEHGESAWAQAAVPRLALLLLYTAAGAADPVARLAAAEKLLPFAHQATAVTDLRLVIADAVFHYRLPCKLALPHLIAAEQAGAMDAPTRADVLLQIAELSGAAGDAPRAIACYQKFLAENPRDSRHYPVWQKLAALGVPH